jgi:endonuclease/exonuclease/phosphatase family metal-dependent hydrolase
LSDDGIRRDRSATLLCWNVAGRVRRLAEQLERVVELLADVICLQEATRSTVDLWRERLADAGWAHSAAATMPDQASGRGRPLIVVTVARRPLTLVPVGEYLHDWRRQGLSDHSPLFAQLNW